MLKKLKMIFLMLYILGQTGILAQEAFTANGGDLSGSGGTTSYSVGQLTYGTVAGESATSFEGVQVPFEISLVVGIQKIDNLSLMLYPNPATRYLILKMNSETDPLSHSILYKLIGTDGQVLAAEKINAAETTISMENFPSSTYFLKLVEGNVTIAIFKIIKR